MLPFSDRFDAKISSVLDLTDWLQITDRYEENYLALFYVEDMKKKMETGTNHKRPFSTCREGA